MAKQTFTTGQVLLASQLTDLQQTAMGGGAATAKTASYVLVAADAGTTIIMNAAGATTITVNTALFAAGDTVNIQNIGAGVCTVTAGTATVNTAGSLALNQYEGGVLYFRSTSAATFFDYVQTGSVSPLTTKGDLYGFSTLDARVPIGTNNQVLTADSAQALGLKWATPTSGSQTSIATGSFSGSSFTISSIAGTYRDLKLVLVDFALSNSSMLMTVNSQTGVYKETSSYLDPSTMTTTNMEIVSPFVSNNNMAVVTIEEYANPRFHAVTSKYVAANVTAPNYTFGTRPWFMNYSQAITSITISSGSGSFSGGTYTLYGVN
jgi:hypothetical protein